MKKYLTFLVIMLSAAIAISSCNKDGHKGFKGNYTFKTGGYVTILPITIPGMQYNMTKGSPGIMALMPESGQMDILDNGGDGKVLVTMNILGGPAVVMNAAIKDDILTLEPYSRIVTLMQSEDEKYGAQVTVSGTARKIDNIIIFDISYAGYVSIGDILYMISASSVEQIAKEN